jgi:hypothetical protein
MTQLNHSRTIDLINTYVNRIIKIVLIFKSDCVYKNIINVNYIPSQ